MPDEALRPIFAVLGGGTVTFSDSSTAATSALALASCCTRLNQIYRTSVRSLSLVKEYSDEDCARLRERFPATAALELVNLSVPADLPKVPTAYPCALAQRGIKSITIWSSRIFMRDLRAMVESCTGLETFDISYIDMMLSLVCTDGKFEERTVEQCSFLLVRHSETLEKLVFAFNRVAGMDNAFYLDVDCLSLSSLTALRELKLSCVETNGAFDFQDVLLRLRKLHALSLFGFFMKDEDFQAVHLSLLQLRSLGLCQCNDLYFRVLQWLPPRLDFLDISETDILTMCPEAEEGKRLRKAAPISSRRPEIARSVKKLAARSLDGCLRFEFFLRNYSGASIEHLDLSECELEESADLVHFLSETRNLLLPDLSSVEGLGASVFSAISHLASLRELVLEGKYTPYDYLVRLANSACRHSLRRVDLSLSDDPEEHHSQKAAAHLLFSEPCLDACEIFWST